MAKGATIPSNVIGIAKSASAAKKEPTTAPTETASRPSTASSRIGRARNGVAATASAATRMIQPRSLGSGLRSAIRPPSQYPTERYRRMSPMMFAQTIVELPK